MDGEDILNILSVVGLVFVLLVLAFIAIPVLGYIMYWMINDVFGFAMNKELYWTGVGLVGVLAFIVGTQLSRDDE